MRRSAPAPGKQGADTPWVAGLLLTPFLFLPDFLLSRTLPAGLDLSNIHLPLRQWIHALLHGGRLPLMTDLSFHGAPVAGLSVVGLFSPLVWFLYRVMPDAVAALRLEYYAVFALTLTGAWVLGRVLGLSRPASALLALLFAYHGRNLAQLDHLNVVTGQAFVPWTLSTLVIATRGSGWIASAAAGFLFALGFATGHPQMAWAFALFVPFFLWGAGNGSLIRRIRVGLSLAAWALLFSAPLLLHSAETLFYDQPGLSWGLADRFYHSWTPFNIVTLLFPRFFGTTALDGTSDYWWQYQYPEMQSSLSAIGLLFAILFLVQPQRRRIAWSATIVFFLFLSMGKFSFLYHTWSHLPLAGSFRDPARYGYPAFWTLSLMAAWGWDRWVSDPASNRPASKVAAWMLGIGLAFVTTLNLTIRFFRPSWESWGLDLVRKWILSDPTYPHQREPAFYAARIGEKLLAAARGIDPTHPDVFLPLLFVAAAWAVFALRPRIDSRPAGALLLLALLADLWFFKTPAGSGRIDPSTLPACEVSSSTGRILSQASGTARPTIGIARRMAYPNHHLPVGRRTLDLVVGTSLPRYDEISRRLGWFSWVYRDRPPAGFLDRPKLLRTLGVDLCVSDVPLPSKAPFQTTNRRFPHETRLEGTRPLACWIGRLRKASWPDMLDAMERPDYDPLRESFLEDILWIPNLERPVRDPVIRSWEDTRLVLEAPCAGPGFLVLQKSYLPSWRARLGEREIRTFRCDGVLTGVLIPPGGGTLELEWRPSGLRTGLFVALIGLSALAFGTPPLLSLVRRGKRP